MENFHGIEAFMTLYSTFKPKTEITIVLKNFYLLLGFSMSLFMALWMYFE